MRKILEKDIQKACLDMLRLKKIFCWKNNTAGIYRKNTGHYIPSQSVGSPDIFCVVKGRIFGLEIKVRGGKQSDNQKDWQKVFEKSGGTYILIKGMEELDKLNEIWR